MLEQLAERAAMSPRNFARAFLREIGTTPAKAVERLRIEAAQDAVESGFGTFNQIARRSGFHDAGQMCRAFLRTLGQPPQALRSTAPTRISPSRWQRTSPTMHSALAGQRAGHGRADGRCQAAWNRGHACGCDPLGRGVTTAMT